MLKSSLAALLLWPSVILAQDNGRAVPTIDELIVNRKSRGQNLISFYATKKLILCDLTKESC